MASSATIRVVGHVDQRPVLLLDIDGVLNLYGRADCPAGYQQVILFPDDPEPAMVSTLHGQWLREAARQYELTWASAWGHQANELLGPLLHLDPMPFVSMPPAPFAPELKVPAIDAHLCGRPAAWIDDVFPAGTREWAEHRQQSTLLIQTDPTEGLQRRHIDEVLHWARCPQ